MKKILISIVTPCFNESDNVAELYRRIKESIAPIDRYNFEIIFIDNASTDDTVNKLKSLALIDKSVKVIVNTRNFGHIRSPYYGILSSAGEATIYLASDLQDPPEIIPNFIEQWEHGYKLVMAIKPKSEGSILFHAIRTLYYKFLNSISEVKLLENSTGFGLYDKIVLDHVRLINDPYPYLRGTICELGYSIKTIEFIQPQRKRGISKNNFYTLYDIGMLGIVQHSKVPLRIATIFGFITGLVSILVALIYLVRKLLNWESFGLGISPIIIGVFFMFGMLFIFLGLLGEYILVMHVKLQNKPIVVPKERINF
jgi:dolichol-phosphate mannosyltransferase